MSIKDVNPQRLTERVGKALREIEVIEPPEWSHFIKTGSHREKPPDQTDWWYQRSASVLRRVFEKGPIGVSRLRSLYGGRNDRGSSPERFRKGSGKIVRTILQQLEKANLVEERRGEGRIISPNGMSILTKISNEMKSEE